MKKVLLFICILGFFSCKKNSGSDAGTYKVDERDSVIGSYSGISIFFNRDSPPPDTNLIAVKLKKSETDSLIILCCNNDCSEPPFKYHNYSFVSTGSYHPPTLKYLHDSLIYHRVPSMGPITIDYLCKRIK